MAFKMHPSYKIISTYRHNVTSRVFSLLFCICLLAGTILAGSVYGEDDKKNRELIPEVAYLPSITVYSLEAEVYPENNILRVKGSFANSSQIAMKGYITIYILNSNGEVLYSTEIPANSGRPFYNGELVEFDEILNVPTFRDAAIVNVDFTRE